MISTSCTFEIKCTSWINMPRSFLFATHVDFCARNYMVRFCLLNSSLSSWWFQPLWKICSSNWESSPHRGENLKKLKPPASYHLPWTKWAVTMLFKPSESHQPFQPQNPISHSQTSVRKETSVLFSVRTTVLSEVNDFKHIQVSFDHVKYKAHLS